MPRIYAENQTHVCDQGQVDFIAGVADEVVPNAAANDKFTVVRVTAGGTVDALASGNLTKKA